MAANGEGSKSISQGPTAREHEHVVILSRDSFPTNFETQPFTELPDPLIHPIESISARSSRSKRRLRHGASTLGAYREALARNDDHWTASTLAWLNIGSSEANPVGPQSPALSLQVTDWAVDAEWFGTVAHVTSPHNRGLSVWTTNDDERTTRLFQVDDVRAIANDGRMSHSEEWKVRIHVPLHSNSSAPPPIFTPPAKEKIRALS
ncbi:hypothetical protein C8R43DRAFT_1237814 [Mycena crocata]|nr:hypothetical protein C8R43DRAFT_1237814 [Mycena crocata]